MTRSILSTSLAVAALLAVSAATSASAQVVGIGPRLSFVRGASRCNAANNVRARAVSVHDLRSEPGDDRSKRRILGTIVARRYGDSCHGSSG